MGIIETIRRWVMSLLNRGDAGKSFGLKPITSEKMNDAIDLWKRMEQGKPPWADGENVRSVSFGNTIARELANLISLNVDVKVDGGENAPRLQEALDRDFLQKSNEIIEKMLRLGGVMAKYNGESIDYLGPDRFVPVETDSSGEITSAVFFSYYTQGRKHYTRAEWHRFEGSAYRISNKTFVSDSDDQMGYEVPMTTTNWKDLQPEVQIEGLEKPLFTYLKNPYSNTIDDSSPLGVSVFSECIQELRWLDIAMSTLGAETEDSKPILFIDSQALRTAQNAGIKLPRFVQALGDAVAMEKQTISEWTPTMQVATRKEGINFYLSIISYKCGFDPGYFVFNGQTISLATAAQVEATERRTINTVLTYRSILDRPTGNGDGRCGFIHDIAYILDAMITASGQGRLSEYGNYQIYADFKDLTSNEEEDRMFDYQLATAGFISKQRFLVMHYGVTDEEARRMVEEARAEALEDRPGLFEEEGI